MTGRPHSMVSGWPRRCRSKSTVVLKAPSCCCFLLMSALQKCLLRRPCASLVSLADASSWGRSSSASHVIHSRRPPCRRPTAIVTISLPIRRRCRFGRLSASAVAITYSSTLLFITPLLILLMRHGSPSTRLLCCSWFMTPRAVGFPRPISPCR